MCNITKSCMDKRSIPNANRLIDYNVVECEKFIDIVSDHTL